MTERTPLRGTWERRNRLKGDVATRLAARSMPGPVPDYRPDLGPCVLYDGCTTKSGYGRIGVSPGVVRNAHRVAWELVHGPVSDGLHLDHLCRVRNCINVAHLEPVTVRENVTVRGIGSVSGVNLRKTHCPAGHPLSGDNLYIRPDKPGRGCLTCRRQSARSSYRRDRG